MVTIKTWLFLVMVTCVAISSIGQEKPPVELKAVTVTGKKPLYEQKIDRVVVNVQGSITSAGNTVLEILQKSPGIVVNRQNNSIRMDGKQGVRVMINDKLVQLPLDVVVQMLDGMSASNVEKIELITTPPAKYDAEGNAGIIHIVLKRSADIGTNGSVSLTAGLTWAEVPGGSINLNHRNNKFAFFLDYSVLRNHNLHIFKFERQAIEQGFVQKITDNSRRENLTTQQNLTAGFEWKLTPNTLLSLSATAHRRDWTLDAVNHDNNQASPDSTVFTHMNIHELNLWQSATAGIGLQSKLDSASTLSFNLDYLYYHNNNPSQYNDTTFYRQHNTHELSKTDLKKTTPIRFLVATADYQYSFSPKLSMETGVKGVTSKLDNNVLVQRLENNTWTIDPVFTSYSTLHEQVGAAYISTKWQAAKQWQINAGLRYEHTHTTISTPAQHNLVSRKYGNLFPGLFIKKEINKGKELQFAYTRRITRPTYNDIAPFVFFWGPNSFSAGNTSLLPAISDAIRVGYHVKKWIISVQFSHTKDEISTWQPERDQSNNLVYRAQNLEYLNMIGLTNSLSLNITPWWEVHSSVTGQYQVAQATEAQHNATFRWYSLNMSLINSWRLPKNFSIEVSGIYQSKTFSGIAEYLPAGSLNAGVQKKLGTKGTLRLAMDDILNTYYWRIKTYMPENNLNTFFSYNFHNQYIRLTYTRNFGNNKVKTIQLKSGSAEERKRVAG